LTGGVVVKGLPGTAVLSGDNSFTGGMEVSSGVLVVGAINARPWVVNDATIGPGATLTLQVDLNLAASARAAVSAVAAAPLAEPSAMAVAAIAPLAAVEQLVADVAGPLTPAPVLAQQDATAGRGAPAPASVRLAVSLATPAVDAAPATVAPAMSAPARATVAAAPRRQADFTPVRPVPERRDLAAHDAALAARNSATSLPDASWLAVLDQAGRPARSSEKTGAARAALDEVLARYGV
jgi:autotransporter-associated beta strand protein